MLKYILMSLMFSQFAIAGNGLFAVCHTYLDEKNDVFFHIYLRPNAQKPVYADIRVDAYKDLVLSEVDSRKYQKTQLVLTKLPELSTLTSQDQQLKIWWPRQDEKSQFSEVKKIYWKSHLTDSRAGLLDVSCTQLPPDTDL